MSVRMSVCLYVCMYVCMSAGLRKNYPTDFHETRWKGVAWPHLEPIKFWSRSESRGGPRTVSWFLVYQTQIKGNDITHGNDITGDIPKVMS